MQGVAEAAPRVGIAAACGVASVVEVVADKVPALAIGISTGAPVAGGVHLLAATTRLGSSVLTLGAGNPVLSVIEDVLASVGVLFAFVIPLVAVVGILLVAHAIRRWRRSRAAHSLVDESRAA
jgi:hypothetical protein